MEELRASLLRAGDHIAESYPIAFTEGEDGLQIGFKLWHRLPEGAAHYVTQYIKGFLGQDGWKVKRVRHQKFMIWIFV